MRAKSAIAWAVVSAGACAASARASDYLLDANYAGVEGQPADGYTAVYRSITTALGASGIPSGASAANPNRLMIAPGTYNTANVTGVSLSNSRNNITLLGLSANSDDVVITSTLDAGYNPGSGALGTTGSATLQLKGNNVSAANITFGNSTNTPYIVSTTHMAVTPQGAYTGTAQTSNQPAVALLLQGDQQAFTNCKFLGYQDTLYAKGGRAYFKNCTVSGDIDFIFANGTTVFNKSVINFDGDHSGGTITAASTDKRTSNGMVFLNSTITGNSVKGNPVIDPRNAANANGPAAKSMNFGRPWGWQQTGGDASTVLINTKVAPVITNAGWLTWNANEMNVANGKNDGNPAKDSRYAEFGTTDLLGNPVDTSGRVAWEKQLTASEASAFTVMNLFSVEADYAWYGAGYAGSADPTSPNFSWPAFWGDRNSNNDTANSLVSATYPTPGNPLAYSDPSWTIAGSWNAEAQLALVPAVPEPASVGVTGLIGGIAVVRRRRI